MVNQGGAADLAEAVDIVVGRLRCLENRRHLADATARYFEQLDPKAATAERALAEDLSTMAGTIDFDCEI